MSYRGPGVANDRGFICCTCPEMSLVFCLLLVQHHITRSPRKNPTSAVTMDTTITETIVMVEHEVLLETVIGGGTVGHVLLELSGGEGNKLKGIYKLSTIWVCIHM